MAPTSSIQPIASPRENCKGTEENKLQECINFCLAVSPNLTQPLGLWPVGTGHGAARAGKIAPPLEWVVAKGQI